MFRRRFQSPLFGARGQAGQWIAWLGRLVIAGAMVCLLVGFSDLENLLLLAIAGAVFIPIGLLLVTNGRILSKLANLEKNTRPRNPDGPSDQI